jgi:hypothetical protein
MNKSGGANTNKNGLQYEKETNITEYKVISKNKYSVDIKFNGYEKIFQLVGKNNLFKHMKDKMNEEINKGHGCKNPDECYIDEESKNIFIIEKKFQSTTGSVCEKIQSPHFKIWQYSRTFPDYKIIYIYCLSKWFRENCKAELEYLDHMEIKYFFGHKKTYKESLIKFINSFFLLKTKKKIKNI